MCRYVPRRFPVEMTEGCLGRSFSRIRFPPPGFHPPLFSTCFIPLLCHIFGVEIGSPIFWMLWFFDVELVSSL